VVVTGGLAGDDDRFEQTWVIQDGRPAAGIISAVGFYSYGEISPFTSGQCELHNQTMTLTTISEVA
ncbi:MAG: FIST N-terminal domain-containing protein, partial [Gammaproteobacteria bacterium]